MLIFLLIASNLILSEARVFCQDSFALPWKPLGYTCPVSCSAVITAINRLKWYDYHQLLNQHERNKINITDTELINKRLRGNAISRKSNRNTKLNKHVSIAYQKLFKNATFVELFKSELDKMAAVLKNGPCHKMAAGKRLKRSILLHKCTRKMHSSQDFLKGVTNILNAYSDAKYKFNEEMTEMLLEKLLGNLDLRYGVLDVRRILHYVQQALRNHKMHARSDMVITLKSKQCLLIRISGCFCQSGYVEEAGQCVRPIDCIKNPLYIEYLERVIVLYVEEAGQCVRPIDCIKNPLYIEYLERVIVL